MIKPLPTAGSDSEAAQQSEFLALILTDPQLLEAEFDAIVAAQFGPQRDSAGGVVLTRTAGPKDRRRRFDRRKPGRRSPMRDQAVSETSPCERAPPSQHRASPTNG